MTTDHLGTPIYATDNTGISIWEGGFEPFGRDYADAQSAGIFLRLPGQWFDPVWEDAALGADLYYNVHRWYEYGTGRYTRVDPLGLYDGPNVYSYGLQNPTLNFDALGLKITHVDPWLEPYVECMVNSGSGNALWEYFERDPNPSLCANVDETLDSPVIREGGEVR